MSVEGCVGIAPARIVEFCGESALPSVAAATEMVDEAVWKDSIDIIDAALGKIPSFPIVGCGERIVRIDDREGTADADACAECERITVVLYSGPSPVLLARSAR